MTNAPYIDENGHPWKRYTLQYQHDNSFWSVCLIAPDDDDAIARVASIRQTLTYEGEIVAQFHIEPKSLRFWGTIVQALCNLRNFVLGLWRVFDRPTH